MALPERLVLKLDDRVVLRLDDTNLRYDPIFTGNKGYVEPGADDEYAVEVRELRVAYNEPRSLTVAFYAHAPHLPLHLNHSRLKLYVNDVLRFNGTAKTIQEEDSPRGRVVVYTAYDALEDASYLAYIDPNSNLPLFYKPLDILTVWTDTEVTRVVYPTIKDCIEKVFTDMSATLTAKGIPTTYSGPIPEVSAGAWYTTNKSVTSLISALVDPFWNCRFLIDPTANEWVFHDLQTLTVYDFDITVQPTPGYSMGIDIRDRYTAVRLIGGDPDATYILMGQAELTGDWNAMWEASWSWKDFEAVSTTDFNNTTRGPKELYIASATDVATSRKNVYRLWSFANANMAIWPSQDLVHFFQLVNPGTANEFFIPVEIEGEIDFVNKKVMTKYPILGGMGINKRSMRNPRIPGKAVRGRLWMRYPVFAAQGVTYGVRVPESGYSGQANTWYGLEQEYVELIEGKTDFAEIALRAMMDHDNLSHVAVHQSLPHLGALPVEAWNLGIAVNIIKGTGVLTRYETLAAPLMAFTHDFTGGGRTTFEFSTDRTRQRAGV